MQLTNRTIPFLLMLGCASAIHGVEIVTNATRTFGLGSLAGAAISPGGERLATFGQSGAFLWDFDSGTTLHRLEAHRAPVSLAAFSPDGAVLLTAARDHRIRSWNAATGQPLRVFEGHRAEITSLSFSRDGRSFLSSSGDGTARIWELETGKVLFNLNRRVWLHAAAFAPDPVHFVTAEGPETSAVRLWRVGSDRPILNFAGHQGNVRFVSFLPDGRLISAGDDRAIRVWDATTGEETRPPWEVADTILALGVSSDGSLVTAATHARMFGWDIRTGALTHDFATDTLFAVLPVPGTNYLLSLHGDDSVRLLDRATGNVVRTFDGHASSTITDLSLSPDARRIASAATEAVTRVWDCHTGGMIHAFRGSGGGSMAARFSPDGLKVLTTSANPHAARIWNAASGALERELIGHSSWLMAAVFSRDGRLAATAAQDQTVRLWNTDSGSQVWTLRGHENWVRTLAFSADGSLLASGGDDLTVRIWDVNSGRFLRLLEGHEAGVVCVAFSPDDRELLTVSENGMLRFWDPRTGLPLRELFVPTAFLETAAYSPNGNFLVTGEGWPFHLARLYDARSLELLAVFAGSTSPVEAVAFGPSGKKLVTGGDVIRTWNIESFTSGVRARLTTAGLELSWSEGALQRARSATGPWEDLPVASPHLLKPDQPLNFFRVKLEAGSGQGP